MRIVKGLQPKKHNFMKNLQNFNVQELSAQEQKEIDGGVMTVVLCLVICLLWSVCIWVPAIARLERERRQYKMFGNTDWIKFESEY
jgi:type II secretory pathway component PulM